MREKPCLIPILTIKWCFVSDFATVQSYYFYSFKIIFIVYQTTPPVDRRASIGLFALSRHLSDSAKVIAKTKHIFPLKILTNLFCIFNTFPEIHEKCCLLYHLLTYFGSLYCKQYQDAQNPAFLSTFNQNDRQKIYQCDLHDAIKKNKTRKLS